MKRQRWRGERAFRLLLTIRKGIFGLIHLPSAEAAERSIENIRLVSNDSKADFIGSKDVSSIGLEADDGEVIGSYDDNRGG